VVSCGCHLVGHPVAETGEHHARCQMANLTSNLACPPASGCCQEDHDHEAAANACPGGHGDCPDPGSCALHASVRAHYRATLDAHRAHVEAGGQDRHAIEDLAEPPPSCPGGHCHVALPDCTVCHPVIITAGIGTAVLRPVAAA
jgi:hypothetical protein